MMFIVRCEVFWNPGVMGTFSPLVSDVLFSYDKRGVTMDEHRQHDNAEHGSARVRQFAERPDNPGAERQHRDQGRVGAFEAKAEELGRNVEALGRKVRALSDSGQVVAAGDYVYAWQRQVAGFYGMRLRKNFEFAGRFAAAGGIAEVVGLQREYMRDTLLDYASSVYQMAGFGLRGARHTAERLDRPE
jgi:hypothetical protein